MIEDNHKKRSLGKLISHISRNIHWLIQHELENTGVGSGQYFFLHLVSRYPGITQNEISIKTDIDKATAAKGIAKLEHMGYLRRVPDQRDRRVRRLFLTPAGEAVMPEINSTLRKVTKVCASDLTDKELDELFHLLDKVGASLAGYIKDNS